MAPDADAVGVRGRSAGGRLVLMLGVSADVPDKESFDKHLRGRNVRISTAPIVNRKP